ncbi:MAG: hypothetical protein HS119_05690 [Flavobacteriales bacterium]|nr:hypothetical protein [Flavobacteriales bacterium]
MMQKITLFILFSISSFIIYAQPVNNNIAGAIILTHTSNNCSANAAYTSLAATADGNAGSCWENGPNYNVWFSFVATTTEVTLDLKVGGAQGSNTLIWHYGKLMQQQKLNVFDELMQPLMFR